MNEEFFVIFGNYAVLGRYSQFTTASGMVHFQNYSTLSLIEEVVSFRLRGFGVLLFQPASRWG